MAAFKRETSEVRIMSFGAVLLTMVMLVGRLSCAVADDVEIVNVMGQDLEVHCMSRAGDDLGYKTIYSGMSWSFGFIPSLWGTTIYGCDFNTPSFPQKHLNVYEGANIFDDSCLCRSCKWTISRDGFDCNNQYKTTWK